MLFGRHLGEVVMVVLASLKLSVVRLALKISFVWRYRRAQTPCYLAGYFRQEGEHAYQLLGTLEYMNMHQ